MHTALADAQFLCGLSLAGENPPPALVVSMLSRGRLLLLVVVVVVVMVVENLASTATVCA